MLPSIRAIEAIVKIDVPAAWADAQDEPVDLSHHTQFFRDFAIPVNALEGDDLRLVHTMDLKMAVGRPVRVQKKNVALPCSYRAGMLKNVSACNQCSFVCPHAAIRPFLMTEAEAAAAPEGYQDKEIKAAPGYKFNIVVSVMDCLGCGSCTHVCPKEALTMTPFDDEEYKAVSLGLCHCPAGQEEPHGQEHSYWQPVRTAAA